MSYRIRRYSNFKRRKHFETYEPKEGFDFRKADAVPLLVRISDKLIFLGGFLSIFVTGLFISVKSFFGFKKNLENITDRRRKIVEIRIKK
ncbi:hypothetical protein GOV14_05010 [Candidatus Pacearchaeota archaeon]|nr:hypothetical protein [Candidatus Pacearchaeota archaeon]